MRVKTHNERIEELETEISELKSTISTLQTTITNSGLGTRTLILKEKEIDDVVTYSGFAYLNNCTASGVSTGNGYLITIIYEKSTYVIQYFQKYNSDTLQVRRCVNGTWTSFTNV